MPELCARCGTDYLFRQSGTDENIIEVRIVPARFVKKLPKPVPKKVHERMFLCKSHCRDFGQKRQQYQFALMKQMGITKDGAFAIKRENDGIRHKVSMLYNALKEASVRKIPQSRIDEMLKFLGEQYGHKVTIENFRTLKVSDLKLPEIRQDSLLHARAQLFVSRFVDKYSVDEFIDLWFIFSSDYIYKK